jgi:hypothetical protein
VNCTLKLTTDLLKRTAGLGFSVLACTLISLNSFGESNRFCFCSNSFSVQKFSLHSKFTVGDTLVPLLTDTVKLPVEYLRSLKSKLPQPVFPLYIKQSDFSKDKLMSNASADLRSAYMRIMNTYKADMLRTVNTEQYFDQLKKIRILTDTNYLLNSIRDLNSRMFNKPVSIGSGDVRYQSQLMPSLPDTARSYFMQQATLNAEAFLSGVPFSVNYNYQQHTNPWLVHENRNIVSAKFDKRAYAARLKSFIPDVNTKALLPNADNIWALAKQKGEALLRKEVKAIEQKYKGQLDSAWNNRTLETLFTSNITSIKDQLLNPDYLQKITDATTIYNTLKTKQAAGIAVDTSALNNAAAMLEQFKGMQEVVGKMAEHKQRWEQSGLVQKLKEEQLFNADRIKTIVNNPKEMLQLAEKYVNINSFQRLLTKFNTLNLGQMGTTQSPLTINNLLSNGISGDLMNNRNQYFSFIAGRQKDMVSLFDRQFQDPLINRENNILGITTGKGARENTHSHISVLFFNQQSSNFGNFSIAPPSRSSFVTTLSNRFNFGKASYMEAEISKSSGGYINSVNPADTSQLISGGYFKNAFANGNITDNLAFSFSYAGEHEELGFYHELKIAATSMGYSNPANTFLPGGSKEGDFSLRKVFFERRLTFNLRGNFREFNFGSTLNSKWQNSSLFFDGRFKLKRGQSISLRYQPSRFVRVESGKKQLSNQMDQISVDATMNANIFGKPYHTFTSLIYQNNGFAVLPGHLSYVRSLMITSTQSMVLGINVLNVNLMYNHAVNNTGFVFFNSTFNGDGGISYTIFKKITSTTSVGYNTATAWYRQLSVKQSLTGNVGSRLQVSFFVDARKNLKLFQPLLYNITRGELSVMYHIF